MRRIYHGLLSISLLLLPLAQGQMVGNPARRGEFPGLSLLPPGSVVRGISLPRYENRRVTAHIMADVLEVVSAQRVKLSGINSSMYREDGEVTVIKMQRANYHFGTEMLETDSEVSVENPRFRASGTSATFSNVRQQGALRGPVHTLLNTSALSGASPAKASP